MHKMNINICVGLIGSKSRIGSTSVCGKLTFENTENVNHVLNCDGINQILNIINKCTTRTTITI